MRALLIICLLLLASSCAPSLEKALKVVTKSETNAKVALQEIKEKQEKATAGFFATNYPPVVKTETNTIIERDTVEKPGPKLDCPPTTDPKTGKTYTPQVQCPSCKSYVERITKTITHSITNTAREKELELLLEQAGELWRNFWFWAFVVLLLAGVVIVFKIRRSG